MNEKILKRQIIKQTHREIVRHAYLEARDAGLDIDTADAVSRKVVERFENGGEALDSVVRDEIQKHAAP